MTQYMTHKNPDTNMGIITKIQQTKIQQDNLQQYYYYHPHPPTLTPRCLYSIRHNTWQSTHKKPDTNMGIITKVRQTKIQQDRYLPVTILSPPPTSSLLAVLYTIRHNTWQSTHKKPDTNMGIITKIRQTKIQQDRYLPVKILSPPPPPPC